MKEHDYFIFKGMNYYTIRRMLKKGMPFNIRIAGTSMEPYLKTGDCVRIQCGNQDFKERGLVLIDWGGAFVVHRLVDKENMLTKGDNLDTTDPPELEIVCTVDKIVTTSEYFECES